MHVSYQAHSTSSCAARGVAVTAKACGKRPTTCADPCAFLARRGCFQPLSDPQPVKASVARVEKKARLHLSQVLPTLHQHTRAGTLQHASPVVFAAARTPRRTIAAASLHRWRRTTKTAKRKHNAPVHTCLARARREEQGKSLLYSTHTSGRVIVR